MKPEDIKDAHLDVRMPLTEDTDQDRLLGLNTGLASPSGTSLELPISTLELERFAKSVQGLFSCMFLIIFCFLIHSWQKVCL